MDNRVYKYICLVLVILMVAVAFVGCTNRSMFDTTWSFERATINLLNGEVIEGRVTSWRDFEDGDSIQLTIDGKTYLTHISNVVLISE